jgi:hypothetical protein
VKGVPGAGVSMTADEQEEMGGRPLHDGLPDRRERARLARFERDERRERGERTRERVTRERTRPWLERDRPDLRRRVWRELRDEQWALVELRERLPPEE